MSLTIDLGKQGRKNSHISGLTALGAAILREI